MSRLTCNRSGVTYVLNSDTLAPTRHSRPDQLSRHTEAGPLRSGSHVVHALTGLGYSSFEELST
jgi:hypothetical protein